MTDLNSSSSSSLTYNPDDWDNVDIVEHGIAPVKDSRGDYRIQAKKYFLTYKGHLEKKTLLDFLGTKGDCVHYIIAHETSDGTDPYDHTHVLVEFSKRLDIRNCRYFDYSGVHPNIGKVRKWDAAINYTYKQDPSPLANISKPQRFTDLVDSIANAPDDLTAYKKCKRLQDLNGAKIIRELKNNNAYLITEGAIRELAFTSLYDWQQSIVDLIEKGYDGRSIHWIYESVGNKGKTHLTKWLLVNEPDNFILFRSSNIDSCIHIARKWINQHNRDPKCVLFDLPRRLKDYEPIYQMAEGFTDGVLTSNKYNSQGLVIRRTPVFVFANALPEIPEWLSLDKWHILNLHNNKLIPIDVNSVIVQEKNQSLF